jgi:lipopolysaccharide biosynthesis protein
MDNIPYQGRFVVNSSIPSTGTASVAENPYPTIPGLMSNWDFVADPVSIWRRLRLIQVLARRGQKSPAYFELKPVRQKDVWTVYFLYAPNGRLGLSQKYSLSRLRDSGLNVFIVCASESHSQISEEVYSFADALYWKALSGYDFSAYTLALNIISRRSPHANVFVMNDSVFGPFTDIKTHIAKAPWELAGFTASSQLENHIQSYAFVLHHVSPARIRKMRSVLFPFIALSDAADVISCQEARFARVAARHMKVGAFWYAKAEEVLDPTLVKPFELLRAGFPFLKRSLLGKHAKFQDPEAIRAWLETVEHPIEDGLIPLTKR